ncbi:MAG: amidohydrolase family protein [Deltaproteobacteria bacterium]|nr:amidohydrolase family protein [Deltaproteobacteria bacterium]
MYDCHMHFDEETVPVEGLLRGMDESGVEKAALIAPMCPNLKKTLLFRAASPVFRSLVRKNPGASVARLIYNSWVKDDGMADVGGKLYRIKPQPNNDVVMAAVRRFPGRFSGWIFVNPKGPASPLHEIGRCLKTAGMIGVKAHPFWHGYPVHLLTDTATFCEKEGLPMLVHLGVGENGDFRLLPDRFPKLRVIYAHCGVPYQEEIQQYALNKPNVFFDLSCSAYVDLKSALFALNQLGAKKCLFGSDGPYFHNVKGRFDYKPLVSMIQSLNLSSRDHEAVCRGNFLEIIGPRGKR